MNVALPVLVFTSFVVGLAALVLLARRILAPTGVVEVSINGRRTVEVAAGRTLLSGLADAGIFLPSACGGRGTCGECRVQVIEGTPPLLPTEAGRITGKDAALGVRLACMQRARSALSLAVPDDLLAARQLTCTVIDTKHVATFLKHLTLRLPPGETFAFEAGDYVTVEAPSHALRYADFEMAADVRAHWQRLGLLRLESRVAKPVRRAYSIASAPGDGDVVELVVRIATPPATAPRGTPPGQVSSYLFGLRVGDTLTVAGPYGSFHAADSQREMVLIGGGAGIAPLRSIVRDQLARGCQRKISLWYGSRDLRDLCFADEFEAAARNNPDFSYHVALSQPAEDDAWEGHTGFIHDCVREHFLSSHPDPAQLEFYLCGPPLMSAAVILMLDDLRVPREQVFYDDFGAP